MKNKTIRYSAPLYVIISGKEGIPFGKPALAMAIDYRVEVAVSFATNENIQKNVLISTIETQVRKYVISSTGISCPDTISYEIVNPDFPVDDISTPLTAACVGALLELLIGTPSPSHIINSLTHQILKKQNRKFSGIESSTVCFGGLIYFRKEFEFLKGIYQLPFNIPKNIENHLVLSIQAFKERVTPFSIKHLKSYEYIEKLTKRIVLSFIKEDIKLFKESVEEFKYHNHAQKITISETEYGKQQIVLFFTENLETVACPYPCRLSKKGISKIY